MKFPNLKAISQQRGTAILELTLVLPLLILICAGVTDMGLILEEHTVLVEASRAGARAAAQSEADAALIKKTAIDTAREYIEHSNLNPDSYMFTIRLTPLFLSNEGPVAGIRVSISSSDGASGFFLPSKWFKHCVASNFTLSGGSPPAESIEDPSC